MRLSRIQVDLRVAFLYAFFGGLWILLSDHLLSAVVTDISALTILQTYKGWAFVVFSALLIFFLLRRDLLLRQITESQLRESDERYRQLFENSRDAVLLTAPDGSVYAANPAACQMFGRTEQEIIQIGRDGVADVTDPRLNAALEERARTGSFVGELTFIRQDGSKFVGEISTVIFKNSAGLDRTSMIIRDVTERKQAEARLYKLNRTYALQSQVNQTIVRVREPQELFEATCRIAVEQGGFRMAWIGLLNPQTKQVKPAAHAGEANGYLEKLGITLDDSERGHGPTAAALRAGEHVVVNDIASDPRMSPWRADALRLGYRASAAFPLIVGGAARGTLNLYASEAYCFDADELQLLDEMVADIAFALEFAEREQQRQQAEEALREKNSQLQLALEISDINIWQWNLKSDEGSGSIPGLSKDSYPQTGQAFFALVHPEDRALVGQSIERAKLTGHYDAEFRVLLPEGAIRWVAARGGCLYDAAGEPVALTGVHVDITERMRTEQVLRESEDRYRDLVEHSQDLICTHDLEGRLLSVNPWVAQSLGYPVEALLRMNIRDLLAPRVRAGFDAYLAEIQRVGKARGIMVVQTSAGEELEWEYRNSLRTEGVAAPIVRGMAHDLTERKRAEGQLRLQAAALESAANAIVITNRDGTIEWVNSAFTALTGYTAEESLGRNPRELVRSGLQGKDFYKRLWDTILAGQVWRSEIVNRRKDGTRYTEELTITPVLGAHSRVTHFVAIKQDVTARKQHELELETVAAVSAALRAAPTRAEMLPIILDQLISLLHVEGAALEMLDPVSGGLRLELGRGVWVPLTGEIIPPGAGLSAHVLAASQPYLNNDARNDPRLYRPDAFDPCHAAAAAPLVAQRQVIGLLWIGSTHSLTDHDLRLLVAIADMAANAIYRASLHEETMHRVEQLEALKSIDRTITASFDLRTTLNVLLDHVTAQLRVDAAAVLLLDPLLNTLDYAAGRGFRTRKAQDAHIRLGEKFAGRAALERRIIQVNDVAQIQERPHFAALWAGEGFTDYYGLPLIVKGQVKGVLEVFRRHSFQHGDDWLNFLETLAQQAAIAIDSAQLFDGLQRSNAELEQAYDATIEGWSRALDLRDKETEGHTQRVTEITLQLAKAMGLGDAELVHIRRGALLHDIGKIGVPDSILLKPDQLTNEEWEAMRAHPQLAYNLISPINYLRPALDIPYCHHERWDGTGYPRGLKGEQIPLTARLFAVVDVWDALCSDRPYRPGWSKENALAHIRTLAGAHFDPQAVALFLQVVGDKE